MSKVRYTNQGPNCAEGILFLFGCCLLIFFILDKCN